MRKTDASGRHEGETAMTFLRRVVGALNYEHESILDDLPTPAAVLDYFALQHAYDTEFLQGIEACIAEGEDPEPLNAFIDRHGLPWNKLARPAPSTRDGGA